jgi:hypothetical protein
VAFEPGDPRDRFFNRRGILWDLIVSMSSSKKDFPLPASQQTRTTLVWIGSGDERDHEEWPGHDTHNREIPSSPSGEVFFQHMDGIHFEIWKVIGSLLGMIARWIHSERPKPNYDGRSSSKPERTVFGFRLSWNIDFIRSSLRERPHMLPNFNDIFLSIPGLFVDRSIRTRPYHNRGFQFLGKFKKVINIRLSITHCDHSIFTPRLGGVSEGLKPTIAFLLLNWKAITSTRRVIFF